MQAMETESMQHALVKMFENTACQTLLLLPLDGSRHHAASSWMFKFNKVSGSRASNYMVRARRELKDYFN
jgi:hypothetical protein